MKILAEPYRAKKEEANKQCRILNSEKGSIRLWFSLSKTVAYWSKIYCSVQILSLIKAYQEFPVPFFRKGTANSKAFAQS